jgi:uncharacterized delta-60 repeat protein
MRFTFKLAIATVGALLGALVAPMPSYAATGVDSSFGTSGLVIGSLSGADQASSVAIQSTGKIVFTSGNAQNKWKVGRLNTNGTLDTSFGNGGYWTGYDGQLRDLTVDKDNNILVVGRNETPNSGNYGTLFRIAPNGGATTGFPPDGTPCGCSYSQVRATNSRIYVAGQDSNAEATVANMNRYLINGSLDYSYGFDGVLLIPMTGPSAPGSSPSLDVDASGLPIALITTNGETRLIRNLNDGSADTSYGGTVAGNPIGSAGLLVLPKGKAVAGLSFADHANFTFFNDAGQIASSVALPAGATPVDTAVTKGGAVALVYRTANSWGIIKTNQNGVVDTGFGNQGWLTQSTNIVPTAVAADNDGRVVIVGATTNNADWAATRVDIDGTAAPAVDWFTQLLINFWKWLLSLFGITF